MQVLEFHAKKGYRKGEGSREREREPSQSVSVAYKQALSNGSSSSRRSCVEVTLITGHIRRSEQCGCISGLGRRFENSFGVCFPIDLLATAARRGSRSFAGCALSIIKETSATV